MKLDFDLRTWPGFARFVGMTMIGPLHLERGAFARASCRRPVSSRLPRPVNVTGAQLDAHRLSDLVALLDTLEGLENQLETQTDPKKGRYLELVLERFRVAARSEPGEVMSGISQGRRRRWFPIHKEPMTEDAILERAKDAMKRGLLPRKLLREFVQERL